MDSVRDKLDFNFDIDRRVDGLDFGSKFNGRSYGLRRGYENPSRSYTYGYRKPNYHAGKILSRERNVGPYSYKRPHVDYDVCGPEADLGVCEPEACLGVDEPDFAARTFGGKLGWRAPVVGNRFKRPEIETFSPKFKFESPEISFKSGRASTQGPSSHYCGPEIEQKWEDPEACLDRPTFDRRLSGPEGHFAVRGPREHNRVRAPRTRYAKYENETCFNPSITEYGYKKPEFCWEDRRYSGCLPQMPEVSCKQTYSHGCKDGYCAPANPSYSC